MARSSAIKQVNLMKLVIHTCLDVIQTKTYDWWSCDLTMKCLIVRPFEKVSPRDTYCTHINCYPANRTKYTSCVLFYENFCLSCMSVI